MREWSIKKGDKKMNNALVKIGITKKYTKSQ